MNNNVFISYRRDDAAAEAQLIATVLRNPRNNQKIFIDNSSIEPGEVWQEGIQNALNQSRYVIVVIGPSWLGNSLDSSHQNRINDSSDWVRQEVALALCDKEKSVIPILVRGSKMPSPASLPNDILNLLSRQAIEVRRDYWDHDIQLLISYINDKEPLEKSISYSDKETKDESLTPDTKSLISLMKYRGQKISTMLGSFGNHQFNILHSKHIELLEAGELVAAHEVLLDIYQLLSKITIEYDDGIRYLAKYPIPNPRRNNILNRMYGENKQFDISKAFTILPDIAATVSMIIEKVADNDYKDIVSDLIANGYQTHTDFVLSILLRIVEEQGAFSNGMFMRNITVEFDSSYKIRPISFHDFQFTPRLNAFRCLSLLYEESNHKLPINWINLVLELCLTQELRVESCYEIRNLMNEDYNFLNALDLTTRQLSGLVRTLRFNNPNSKFHVYESSTYPKSLEFIINRLAIEPIHVIRIILNTTDDCDYYKKYLHSNLVEVFAHTLSNQNPTIVLFSLNLLLELNLSDALSSTNKLPTIIQALIKASNSHRSKLNFIHCHDKFIIMLKRIIAYIENHPDSPSFSLYSYEWMALRAIYQADRHGALGNILSRSTKKHVNDMAAIIRSIRRFLPF